MWKRFFFCSFQFRVDRDVPIELAVHVCGSEKKNQRVRAEQSKYILFTQNEQERNEKEKNCRDGWENWRNVKPRREYVCKSSTRSLSLISCKHRLIVFVYIDFFLVGATYESTMRNANLAKDEQNKIAQSRRYLPLVECYASQVASK